MRRVGFGLLVPVSLFFVLVTAYYLVIHLILIFWGFLPGGCSEGMSLSYRPCPENPPEQAITWILNVLGSAAIFTLLLGFALATFLCVARAGGRNPKPSREVLLGAGLVVCAYSMFVLMGFYRIYTDVWNDWAGRPWAPDEGYASEYARDGALAFGGTAVLILGLGVWLILRLVRGRPADMSMRVRGTSSGATAREGEVADHDAE